MEDVAVATTSIFLTKYCEIPHPSLGWGSSSNYLEPSGYVYNRV
jgi:hypothetical protein